MSNGAPDDGYGGRLLDRLPPHIAAGLTAEQRAAIASAARERAGGPPAVNIRMTLPLPGRPVFLTLLAGRERRSAERRRAERARNPLGTTGNVLFVLLAAVAFYAIAVGGIILAAPPAGI